MHRVSMCVEYNITFSLGHKEVQTLPGALPLEQLYQRRICGGGSLHVIGSQREFKAHLPSLVQRNFKVFRDDESLSFTSLYPGLQRNLQAIPGKNLFCLPLTQVLLFDRGTEFSGTVGGAHVLKQNDRCTDHLLSSSQVIELSLPFLLAC